MNFSQVIRFAMPKLAIILLLIPLMGCGEDKLVRKTPFITPEVRNFFGEDGLFNIQNMEKVSSYKLEPKKIESVPAGEHIMGYKIVKKGRDLNAEELLFFKNILLDYKTYNFNYAKRQAIFFPEYAFIISDANNKPLVTLLFDFYRKEMIFKAEGKNGKEGKEDFDGSEKDMKRLIKKLF